MLYQLLARFFARPEVFAWLLARAQKTPYAHITSHDGKTVYMYRYWLFNPHFDTPGLRRFSWFPWSLRIHHIMRPDDDRHLHDHPWNARTFILKGGYTEEREDGELLIRTMGETASLRFREYHRIRTVSKGGGYTLFLTGRKRGTWGFKVDGVKVPYYEYLDR